MTASGAGKLGGRGIKQNDSGHKQHCGDCCGEGHIRGLHNNGKNTMKVC